MTTPLPDAVTAFIGLAGWFDEISAPEYQRRQVTLHRDAGGGVYRNNELVLFGPAKTNWGRVMKVGYAGSPGGKMFSIQMTGTLGLGLRDIDVGERVQFAVGALCVDDDMMELLLAAGRARPLDHDARV